MTRFIFHQNKIRPFELPGKRLTGFITYLYLSILLFIPLLFLIVALTKVSLPDLNQIFNDPRIQSGFRITFFCSFIASIINLVFGTIVAWVHVKYNYFGKKFFDMLIDLPFALPTAVTGIVLTAVFSQNEILGKLLMRLGIHVNYTSFGIILALLFIGIPFVIRSIEPALADFDFEMEQAAKTLGANKFIILKNIFLPNLFPALLSGFTSSFARGLGEYGSVIFISGNLPFKTEVVSYLIVNKLEQFDYNGATIIACLILFASFLVLLLSSGILYFHKKKVGLL